MRVVAAGEFGGYFAGRETSCTPLITPFWCLKSLLWFYFTSIPYSPSEAPV